MNQKRLILAEPPQDVEVQVTRGEKTETVRALDLCVGDFVELKSQRRVVADVRILESKDFTVDNFYVTHQQGPQPRSHLMTHDDPLKTENLAFYGSYALEGEMSCVRACGYESLLIGYLQTV